MRACSGMYGWRRERHWKEAQREQGAGREQIARRKALRKACGLGFAGAARSRSAEAATNCRGFSGFFMRVTQASLYQLKAPAGV